MSYLGAEPMPIFVGGLNINNTDGNSSITVGEANQQNINSLTKNNINGQVYGQSNVFTIQPINSPVVDPDGVDSFLPVSGNPSGLED
jgi:hypothetical protein